VANPYLHVLRAQVRSQTQYRASFVMDILASGLFTTLDVATVLVLFGVGGSLGGFGFGAVLLMAALAAVSFATADMVVGNVERLRLYVRTGLFDSVLIRPLSAMGQLVVMDFQLRKIGRVGQGLLLYGFTLAFAGIDWTPGRAALAVLAPLAGTVFFSSVFAASSTVAFWWIESGELAASVTYGGRDFATYPLTVFDGTFRTVFGYGLGFAFVAYLPALALLGIADPLGTPSWSHWCSPATALIAAAAAALLWRTGIRHYRSTGS
jgi:ABC-2 type transport system permease protein